MCEMLAVIIVASIAFDECFSGALNPFRTGESTDVLAVPFGSRRRRCRRFAREG